MADYWIEDSIKDKCIEDVYEIGMELHRAKYQVDGAMSFVSACYHLKTQGRFGVTVIRKKVNYKPKPSKIDIFLKLKQINLISVHEVYETSLYINIVRDIIDGLPLFEYFTSIGPYSEYTVGSTIRQILEGIRYLHVHNIIHGNLKSSNIIIERSTETVKIGDFVQSIVFDYDIYRILIRALPSFCPPEILKPQPLTKSIDLWFVGLITFILLHGYEPFYRPTECAMFSAVLKGEYKLPDDGDVNVTNSSRHFIDNLLLVNAASRMNVLDALNHTWLKVCRIKKSCILYEVYSKLIDCIDAIDDRLNAEILKYLRRTKFIFECLVEKIPYKVYKD